jgi:hypothetical protein
MAAIVWLLARLLISGGQEAIEFGAPRRHSTIVTAVDVDYAGPPCEPRIEIDYRISACRI